MPLVCGLLVWCASDRCLDREIAFVFVPLRFPQVNIPQQPDVMAIEEGDDPVVQ
jgi:hypothetical protein